MLHKHWFFNKKKAIFSFLCQNSYLIQREGTFCLSQPSLLLYGIRYFVCTYQFLSVSNFCFVLYSRVLSLFFFRVTSVRLNFWPTDVIFLKIKKIYAIYSIQHHLPSFSTSVCFNLFFIFST